MDIDKWLEEKYPTWNLHPLQKQLFRDAVEGKRTIGWWRGDRYRLMKAVFDYIVERRVLNDNERGTETAI